VPSAEWVDATPAVFARRWNDSLWAEGCRVGHRRHSGWRRDSPILALLQCSELCTSGVCVCVWRL